ncbi:MAG: hydroxymethylglutaryl-CoA reductase [Acidobacteriota bacterium]
MKLPSFLKVPSMLLKQLYTYSSLENTSGGVKFSIKNRLNDAKVTGIHEIRLAGESIPLDRVSLQIGDQQLAAAAVTEQSPVDFPLRQVVEIHCANLELPNGKHAVFISVQSDPFGKIEFEVEDGLEEQVKRTTVPLDKDDNYSEEVIAKRQRFVEEFSGTKLEHTPHYSFDARVTQGNIENFSGVAQVPLGFAGPLNINGEHAQGEFVIPLATAEGTLVASYNRGMKVLNLSGGVKCTVVADCMQRAPVFVFDSAREARDFAHWVDENIEPIREAGEATSSVAKLLYIDTYLSNKFTFLRFNYSTGDAAGQNMVGRATFAACSWILEQPEVSSKLRRFYLESNFATDKKASQVNIMRTRGKRVTAECTIPKDVLVQNMRVEPETLQYHAGVANMGSFMSGANNNGLHSPNGITAMFIATGQDVANVSESSAGLLYSELTKDGDFYVSITIPSLIVATYGGGTSLPTQRECLEILDCYGRDRVNKFAEIVAGVVLAGEISLASAISALDWVSSHEQYGRNR